MKIKSIILLVFVTLMVAGCYPGGVQTYDETDLVLTSYNKTYDFKAMKTYAMSDKVVKVTGNIAAGQNPEYLDNATATLILNQIKTNMTSRGYTQVAANADMVIFPAVVSTTTLVTYCGGWWGYWGWYGYYPGYPGYGGCYYPSGYTYTTGSVLMTMVDDKTEDHNPTTPVNAVWSAVVNGLLSGSATIDNSRIVNTINQAFVQSPYLTNK